MNSILSTILKDTYTLSQLKHRLSILKTNLLQKFFGGDDNSSLNETDSSWLKSLSEDFLKNFTKDNIYKIFEEIEKNLAKLTPVTLYLTFEPDDSMLTQIGEYGRRNFGPSVLFDIKYDPRLIAGAALVWKGVYRDYSLRSKIEERKMLIQTNFKKFLR